MEVAVIDWKSIDSRFEKDEVYEHITAPQWVDLAAPADPVNDDSWFCRPDCDHPMTVEDFFKQTIPTPKRSAAAANVSVIPPPLGEQQKQRDGRLKKRGVVTRWDKIVAAEEDSENQNPNLSTPPPPNYNNKLKKKEAVKSSTEKTKIVDDDYYVQHKEERKTPNLRRTLSARNLFGGGEMLNKITEFCNDLKKLATRGGAKEREENTESNYSVVEEERADPKKMEERTPLLEIAKQMSRRKKRCNDDDDGDDAENTIPISIAISIGVNNKSSKQHKIRTYPPTPQCFSNANRAAPPKVFRSKPPMERGILQELAAAQSSSNKDDGNNNNHLHQDHDHDHARARGKQHTATAASIINAEKEAKALDVFWFLKPCTL